MPQVRDRAGWSLTVDITSDMNEMIRQALLGATFEIVYEELIPCMEAHTEAIYHADGHRVTRTMTGTLTNLTLKEKA